MQQEVLAYYFDNGGKNIYKVYSLVQTAYVGKGDLDEKSILNPSACDIKYIYTLLQYYLYN